MRFSRISSRFDTRHKYKNLNQIKSLTPRQLINIDPKTIRDDIYNEYDLKHLSTDQAFAMNSLLEWKKKQKKNPDFDLDNARRHFEKYMLNNDEKRLNSVKFDYSMEGGRRRTKRHNKKNKKTHKKGKKHNKKTNKMRY
jgi:hypothetical protein